MKKITVLIFLLLLTPVLLSGCSSIAKGITQAIMEDAKKEDTRACEIEGGAFNGISYSLAMQAEERANGQSSSRQAKVLMVHGLSKHEPGYSTSLREKLTTKLGLSLISEAYKEFEMINLNFGKDNPIGNLRITRHLNEEKTQELLFYELTWSKITDGDKEKLNFDNSGEYSYKRADVNQLLKKFFNSTVPDLLVYRGKDQEKINSSIGQATCWLFHGDWETLPKEGRHLCDSLNNDFSQHIKEDDFYFITHSLGSRITVDTLSMFAAFPDDPKFKNSPEIQNTFSTLKDKDISIFMMSNQLPLLDLGLEPPEILGQKDQYCKPQGADYKDRLFRNLELIAFSDPNDILSYPLPAFYGEKYIDSRTCYDITNASINIAEVKEIFGAKFANPLTAHSGYQNDDRVISIIANGLNKENMDPLIAKRCNWIEHIE